MNSSAAAGPPTPLLYCSVSSFCTGLWQCPAMAVLLRGTADMHALLHCYSFSSCPPPPPIPSDVLHVFAVLPSKRTDAECMVHHQRPGLPKEPPQTNSTFCHSCSFCTSCRQFVNHFVEGCEWRQVQSDLTCFTLIHNNMCVITLSGVCLCFQCFLLPSDLTRGMGGGGAHCWLIVSFCWTRVQSTALCYRPSYFYLHLCVWLRTK